MKKIFIPLFIVVLLIASCSSPTSSQTVIKLQETGSQNYTPSSGEVELNLSLPFADQVTEKNKTYIIRDSFNLSNKKINLPDGVSLKFFGGSISNGTINFNNTTISGYAKFINCSYSGSLSNDTVEMEWFDLSLKSKEGEKYNIPGSTLSFPYYDSTKIQQIIDCCKVNAKIKVDKQYVITNPLTINKKITFEGLDNNEGIYGTLLSNFQYGFATSGYISCFVIENGGEVSMTGITVLGNINFYIGQFTWEKEYSNGNQPSGLPYASCGIDLEEGGKINTIINSSFTGFTYGIRSNGGSIGLIRNSYCSDSRYGFWAKDTNSFECRGCRFNTNKLNFNFFKYDADYQSAKAKTEGKWKPILEDNGEGMYKVGGGVYLENCQDVHINKCRFEFNFIHAMIISSGKDIYFDGCIYDTATISQVLIHNEGDSVTAPAMNNITFSNSTFARGARCDVRGEKSTKGYGIVYITDKGNRGSNINFISNIVSDNMEVDKSVNVQYEKYVFCINSTSTSGTKLNIKNNSFMSAEAEYIYHSVDSSSGTYNIEEKGNDYGKIPLLSDNSKILNFTLRTNGDINENYK